MYIEKQHLLRFCQHTDLELNFSPGLNVIVGPIGSGKSNILKGIRFAFTNDSGNEGKQEDDIQAGSDPSATSSVSLVGVHRSQRFSLVRKLRPSSREFQWEGSPNKLRAAKAISEELYERMGVDVSMFDEFVIVPQGEIANIIDLDDAKRTESMHNLVGLQRYSKYHAWLGEYLSGLVVPTVPESAEELHRQRLETDRRLGELRKQLATLQAGQIAAEQLGQAQQVIESRALVVSLQHSIENDGKLLAQNVTDCDQWKAHLQKVEAKLLTDQQLVAKLESDQAAVVAEIATLHQWELYDSYQSRIDAFKAECQLPTAPEGYLAPTAPELATLKEKQQQLAVLLHLQSLTAQSGPKCPTCFQPIPAEVTASFASIDPLRADISRINNLVTISRDYDSKVARAMAAQASADQALPSLLASQTSLGLSGQTRPAGNIAMLREAARSLSTQLPAAKAVVKASEEAVATAKSSIAAFAAQAETLQAQLDQARQKLSGLPPVQETDYQAALTAVQNAGRLREQIAETTGTITATQATLQALNARYDRARTAEIEAESVIAYRADVERCRQLFHRDQLPFELAKNGMLALASRMNEVLAAFNASFRVSAGAGSSFKAVFYNQPGKGIQPDTRLSGGERAQYGLALRVAAHSLWAQELGFLALDEPTYGFGQHDLGCVRVAIEELRRLSNEQGLQVIVVTHERSLLPLFDNVIEVR